MMSALPPESGHVRRKHECPLRAKKRTSRLLDSLIGCCEQRLRSGQTKPLCGRVIANQFVLVLRLLRHIGWLLALEDAIDIPRGPPDCIVRIRSVRDQATVYSVIAIRINGRQFVASSKTDYELATSRRAH